MLIVQIASLSAIDRFQRRSYSASPLELLSILYGRDNIISNKISYFFSSFSLAIHSLPFSVKSSRHVALSINPLKASSFCSASTTSNNSLFLSSGTRTDNASVKSPH